MSALDGIHAEWTELWERTPSATPFQTPEWVVPWCRHFGPEAPWVLVARQEGRMVGLAPLFVHQRPDSQRVVSVLGSGVTDHLDVLVDPELEQAVTQALFGYLARESTRWDLCDFEQLRPASPLAWMPLPYGWSEDVEVQEHCPVLQLPPSPDDLLRVLPLAVRRKLRYYGNLARKSGPVTFETADGFTLDEHLDAFFRFQSAGRPGERDLPRPLQSPSLRLFYREAAERLLARGELRLCSLRLCGAIVGSVCMMVGHGRAHSLLGGSDPAFGRLSPALLTLGFAMEEAIRAGAIEFECPRQGESSHDAWGAQDRPNRRRRFTHARNANGLQSGREEKSVA